MEVTGSLRVRRGIYHLRFSYKDMDGNWIQKEESTGLPEKGNKRNAGALLKCRLEELEKKSVETLASEHVLFLDAFKDWLDTVMVSEIRPNTLCLYNKTYEKHFKPYKPFQGVTLPKLTPRHLQRYYNDKIAEGLSPNTVIKHHSNFHKFLDYVWKLGLIDANPAKRVTLPKRRKSKIGKAYTAEQLQALNALFTGDILEPVVMLTAFFGFRRSEIAGLRWDAINLDAGRLHVCHTAVSNGDGKILYVNDTKSESSNRVLPISRGVAQYLRQLLAKQEEERLLMGDGYHDSGYVCRWPDGSPVKPEYISRHFAAVLSESNLPKIRFHDLRHSSASLLHAGGRDLLDIKAWMGHAELSTTADIYSHIFFDGKVSMADTLDRMLYSKAAGR